MRFGSDDGSRFRRCLWAREWQLARMKVKKSLELDVRAVAIGERLAAQRGKSGLSALVEEQLLAMGKPEPEHYSPYHGKPMPRPGDPRYEYLERKHGGG